MAKITSIGIHLPEEIITNDDLRKEFPKADFDSFEKTVGVISRHVVSNNETALDLSVKAAQTALEKAGNPSIDFILYCTQTPDHIAPGNATILQDKLKLDNNIGALDFNLGCSGYVYGLALAHGLLSSGISKSLLLITSDNFTRFINPKDRINKALFGDGATASIIDNSGDSIGKFVLGTDGSGLNHLCIPNGGARNPYNPDAPQIEYGTGNITNDNHFKMEGLEVFSFTTKTVPKLVNETLEKNNLKMNDIDHFIFHQANEYILKYLKKKIRISDEKFYINMKNVGNTNSSTIPLGLNDLINQKKIIPGQKIMLVGYGIGLSWGAVVINT